MSTEQIQLQNQLPNMDQSSSTYQCPHCDREVLESNQAIHDAVCARMNGGRAQRSRLQEPVVRHSSSGNLPAPENRTQPSRPPVVVRREERRIAENKMVACPNCEKSVRDQELTDHMNFDCAEGDKIPCEFCDKTVKMSSYNEHVESCPMRPQANQNNRSQSADRNPAPQRREEQRFERQESHESQESQESAHEEIPPRSENQRPAERNRSAPRESSGTFMGFIQNLAGTALQSYAQNRQNPFIRRNIAGLLSKAIGGGKKGEEEQQEIEEPEYDERESERERERQRTYEEAQERAQEEQRMRMRNFLSQMQAPRSNSAQRSQEVRGDQTMLVRTLERGPGGSVLVRTRRVPRSMAHQMSGMSAGDSDMNSMGPLGLMMSMLGGRVPGHQGMAFNPAQMGQPEPEGLDRQTIDSLSTVKYSASKNKNVDSEAKTCPICLEEFVEGDELRFLWCMHRFHQKCIDSWLDKHTNCPICKKDYSEAQNDLSA